jgi:type VI secretion system protein ImpC
MAGHLRFELTVGGQAEGVRRREEASLRVLVLGDFSAAGAGAAGGARAPLASRRVRAVDIDRIEGYLASLGVALELPAPPGGSAPVRLEVGALDDLHPDALYRRLPVFQRLEDLRRRLGSRDGFADAAEEVRQLVQASPGQDPSLERAPVAPEPSARPAAPVETNDATLARLLGERPARAVPPAASAAGPIIRGAVGPHVEPPAPARRDVYLAALDEVAGTALRALLRSPALRALEAGWRSLHWLASSLETGESLTLHALDLTREELAADLVSAGADLRGSALYRLLVSQGVETAGGEPWSLVVADFSFAATAADAGLLAALAAVASRAGGPVLTAAAPGLLGCGCAADLVDPSRWGPLDPQAETAWRALRASPWARWVGLVLPRVLLRLPYGRRAERVEALAFEEVPDPGDHEAFLWGNPAYAAALLVGRAFEGSGWGFTPGDVLDLDDLPAYTFSAEGETRLLPCAEVDLGERAVDAILARGPMPLVSYRNRPTVRLVRFQSLADPPAALAGPWGGGA